MSTQLAKIRVAKVRVATLRGCALTASAVLFSISLNGIARADCKWPEAHDIEERHRIPTIVAGFPFVWEFYSYHLPVYQITSLQCSDTIEWGPRGWSLSLGKETTALSQRTGSGKAASTQQTRALPPLPALPPVPQSAASRPLPPLPSLKPLPNLPALPPVPPL